MVEVVRVLPAHAGMARTAKRFNCHDEGVLPAHAGMARALGLRVHGVDAFSPHTRGWPADGADLSILMEVLPAHAGMAR